MRFAWSDGILLQALKNGDWVLLDELNLAPQSVLEGLTAILDHRAEVFIPELGQTYKCPTSFRVFACQNPSCQGGGRKGLPKSFLNRFTKVHRLLKEDVFLNTVYIQRMHTAADRQEVVKLYAEVFGVKPFINPYPRLQVNPRYLIVGNTVIERNRFQPSETLKGQLSILPGIRHSLESVAHCVQHQWLCILVGPSASGKSSVVRLLADLTGNVLNELNLSSATDISELLGCFEQYNAFRSFRSAITQVERYIDEYCGLSLELEAIVLERKDLVSKWFKLLSSMYGNPTAASASAYADSWKSGSGSSLAPLILIVEQLKLGLEKYHFPVSWSAKDLNKVLKSLKDLLDYTKKEASPTKFEWVTGMLIKAIECGEWIVLENANLCNPTVLDRINSLVEPSGSITVNERGLVEGRPVVLRPKCKFRIFLTVNPRYGEVSRAMRNRGVEVFMMQPDWLHEGEDGYNLKGTGINDVKRFLVLSGIPSSVLVDVMTEAHMFARDTGVHLGVQITLLELSRWVQLFQQLLMNGSTPLWSLQLSWEHTYLSSLGEFEGRSAVEHAKNSFLSASNLSKLDACLRFSLSLPGGWPTPLKLRNFVLHSKEASVRQNCMYLEFLVAQSASYELSGSHNGGLMMQRSPMNGAGHISTSSLDAINKLHPSLIPLKMLLPVLFPTTPYQLNSGSTNLPNFDLALVNKMLLFAANWTIEQANEGDIKLYLHWFSLYSSQLHPYCRFFESYLSILKQELSHRIWNWIFDCRRELITHCAVDIDFRPISVLSLKILDFRASDESLQRLKKRLYNSVVCVELLRHSLQQWNAEDDHNHREENTFSPVLESLRELEKEVLDKLVDSPSFDLLFQIYSNVIEHHSLLWNGIISSNYECVILSWRSLKKHVMKLQSFFPKAVENLLVRSIGLGNISAWNLQSVKSMLWVNGGHPLLPSSADTYSMRQQLLQFCQLGWPTNTVSWKQASSGNHVPVKAILSANAELRFLAMQGVCMASFLTSKDDLDDASVVQQLDEMRQILLRRFQYETQKLEAVLMPSDQSFLENDLSACCVFCPEKFHKKLSLSSWQEMFCLFDSTSFFLDMELLKEFSSAILADGEELYKVLSNNSELLETSLKFSLKFSSRPPTDFIPHQTMLWALDAWDSVDSVNTKIASSILEMWFNWHSLLWIHCPEPFKVASCDSPLPYMLFQPPITTPLEKLLQGSFSIKEFDEQCLKLRVACGNLWHYSLSRRDLPDILLSAARSLFEQIIYAHKKSFGKEKYAEIRATFDCIHGHKNKYEKLQSLSSLIASSSHSRLTSSLDSFVMPLLRELYLQSSSQDFLENLGHAWLHVGGLRFQLLLTPDDLDPAIKYSIKHSQVVEKISLLGLEIEVRQECEELVGRSSSDDMVKQKQHLLEKMEEERRRLQRKVVFRHDASKFTRLKSECADFVELTTSITELTKNVTSMSTPQMIRKAINWQETATSFINRLSDEYAAYADIVQPVQVAVYEMKLGLSLIVSSALQKTFLAKLEEGNTESILETIHAFMQFPRGFEVQSSTNEASNLSSVFFHSGQDVSADILAMDRNILKKLCTVSRDSSSDKTVSVLQLHATLDHNFLARIRQSVVNSLIIGDETYMLLNEIFDRFAGLWMSMKVQSKAKEADEARSFKFKTRAFKIEDILEVDVSTLRDSFSVDSLSVEWQEIMGEDECTAWVAPKELENLEEEWGLIQDSILNSMVHIHNQIFGSPNVVENISDAENLFSFVESYRLGLVMVKALPALLPCSLDAKIVPEHLLSLCLGYEEKFGQMHHPARIYNIYKDSNAPVMAKMVNPLITIQQRLLFLLIEWPDHPGLQKVLDIIKMLLAIPLTTPLPKVLSALQFLLNKAHQLEENAPKLSVSGQMQPILNLVFTWQKMELESWPALLDGVQEQYEVNSGKLWFPLYSVLYRGKTADVSRDDQSTIQSLEEFMQTSSVGEFKKRLQLLVAFHGQINTGLKLYSCHGLIKNVEKIEEMENVAKLKSVEKILYNVFGYYVQFLPVVSQQIEAIKRNVSADLREVVKLYRWERRDNYLSLETSKNSRQKLRKHIQKFNDVLQQPVMFILNQEAEKRIKGQSVFGKKLSSEAFERSIVSQFSVDLKLFSDEERLIWYTEWRKKVVFALEHWCATRVSLMGLPYLSLKDAEDTEGFIRLSLSSQSTCLMYSDEWSKLWFSIEKIFRRVTECADLWEIEKKNFGKRRALSDLLKLLESCGLSRHRSMSSEDAHGSNQPTSWFLQPSYNMQHLLVPPNGNCSIVDATCNSQSLKPLPNNFDSSWIAANHFYYSSMAMVHLLRKICLNFHKDISLDQVTRSVSFLEHLIIIQQEQRSVAYKLSEDIQNLRGSLNSLNDFHTNPSFTDHVTTAERLVSLKQHATRKCMWKQKKLFDSLYALSHETSLFLRKVEVTHLNTCQSVKFEANEVLACIEKLLPNIRKSKESLDQYLLGGNKILTTPEAFSLPFIVSKPMEQLVMQNFVVLSELEENIQAFTKHDVDKRSVKEPLIGHFLDLLSKGKATMQEFCSFLEPIQDISVPDNDASSDKSSDCEAKFASSFNETLVLIRVAYEKFGSLTNGLTHCEDSLSENINQWKVLVGSYQANMKLDCIHKQLGETITTAVHLIDNAGKRISNVDSQIQTCLNHLHSLVNPLLTLGDGFLLEFITMHKKVAEMTHMLANVFASLYSKGFGASTEDQTDDTGGDMSQDASGTGMGEGAGVNDVSDQIENEDQLVGCSEKPSDEQDTSNEAPSKNDKGIEMDQDFAADILSVSEDSGDDDNEDIEDEKIESAMGSTGENNEVVDEKLWNKDDEGNPDTTTERYEEGPSVRDKDSSSRELRAKEDDANSLGESGELNADEPDKDNTRDGDENDSDLDENVNDMELDKEAAYADPTGIQIDDQRQGLEEDANMEDIEGSDTLEEQESTATMEEENAENNNASDDDGKTNQLDEDAKKTESGQVDGDSESCDPEKDHEVAEMDLWAPSQNTFELGEPNFPGNTAPSAVSGMQPKSDAQTSESRSIAPKPQWSNSEHMEDGIAPSMGLPSGSIPETELTMPDSTKGEQLCADEQKAQSPQQDNSSVERAYPNPHRSVGDALQEWKERVKLSVDAEELRTDAPDDMEEGDADEYGYVPELEKGTSQALGPATSDQIDRNIKGSNPDGDESLTEQKGDFTKKEVQKKESELLSTRSHSTLMDKLDAQMCNSGLRDEVPLTGALEDGRGGADDDPETTSKNMVSIKKDEEMLQLSDLTMNNEELGKAEDLEISGNIEVDATTLWRRYEQITTRLSQELAEQLRLVMEPTLARGLEGDYKTGKRINMKKVPSYIASGYMRDKIWLRRTRPNKRDYQVVVAIDDSRSMSESHCQNVAIEALVTVCRAMSQLEVGQLAVASFGKKGNIRLLHDFDQQFTGEAGLKMISGLTFEQENSIEDEPVLDLLLYLNKMLDAAATNSRLSSGKSPLQQLVLIIADGRFHEKKERLKRCVRDLLGKNRMVAFLLLDNPQESIMDFEELSFQGRECVRLKYLNSFPFPYYIVLKNIEALPRTLADLLRQWFELMQNVRE